MTKLNSQTKMTSSISQKMTFKFRVLAIQKLPVTARGTNSPSAARKYSLKRRERGCARCC